MSTRRFVRSTPTNRGRASTDLAIRYVRETDTDRKQQILSRLVRSTRFFVSYRLKRFLATHQGSHRIVDDLFQEGLIGVLDAAARFDPDRGVRFSTFAAFWIFQRMKRCYAARLLIHVPEYVLSPGKSGTTPNPDQLEAARRAVMVGDELRHEEAYGFLGSLPEPKKDAGLTDWVESLHKALARLTEEERQVVELRYGLSGEGVSRTVRYTAGVVGCRRSRAWNLEQSAITKLRAFLAEEEAA